MWRFLFIVFGFWMIVLLFVTMELSSSSTPKSDKEKLNLNRIELAEKTVAELKSRNMELQRMLSSIINANPLPSSVNNSHSQRENVENIDRPNAFQQTLGVNLDIPLFEPASENLDLFLRLSSEYKNLYNQILESWFYLRSNVKDDTNQVLYDRFRLLFSHAERFRDILEPMKWKYAKNLSHVIYQRINHLQNPPDCSSAKFTLCDIGKGCGFGCQIHHVAYCLMVSYTLRRTMYLHGKPWSYSHGGFTGVFHPLGTSDKCSSYISAENPVDWDGTTGQTDPKLIKIPIVDSIRRKPAFFPMSIPEDMADQIKAFHTQPFIWWVGHFIRYILRPLPTTCNSVNSAIEKSFSFNKANFSLVKPLVAIQVRRTDKLLSEAQFHGVKEYMLWVKEYYDQLEYKLGKKVTRSVYIATDEPSVHSDAVKEYPDYKFYNDPEIAKSASLNTRYSESSLLGILIDIYWLAKSDFVVCTFSSQVCRLAFALMQTLHGDAGDRFRSLDDIYYYGGQRNHLYEAILPHIPSNKEEVPLKPGDTVHIAGNHWNGYSKGTNTRSKKHGLFPSYKVRDVIFVAKMPSYSDLQYKNDFQLPDDSCLVL